MNNIGKFNIRINYIYIYITLELIIYIIRTYRLHILNIILYICYIYMCYIYHIYILIYIIIYGHTGADLEK